MDLTADEQALLQKWDLLKRIQSSGEDGTSKVTPHQSSEAERRAKLHEAAKQALCASGVHTNDDSSKQAAPHAREPGSSEEDEPLAQPKREEKKEKKLKKGFHTAANKMVVKSVVETVAHHHEVGTQAIFSSSEGLVHTSAYTQDTADQIEHQGAPPFAEDSAQAPAPSTGTKAIKGTPAATGKCELVYDDI